MTHRKDYYICCYSELFYKIYMYANKRNVSNDLSFCEFNICEFAQN
jgi:hypothetical protein